MKHGRKILRGHQGESHNAAGWGIDESVELLLRVQTLKSIRSGNGRPLIALRCLLLVPVSTPLPIVNHYCSGFRVSGGI